MSVHFNLFPPIVTNYGVFMGGPLHPALRSLNMTPEQREEQRRSFAFGNANLDNPAITREMIDDAAECDWELLPSEALTNQEIDEIMEHLRITGKASA